MFSLRSATRIVAATALIGVAGEATGQPAPTPAEMAKVIASAIGANTAKVPGGNLVFESATSHDNVVELKYSASDAGFARLKAGIDQLRLSKLSYYCNESRKTFLKQGVVMREVIAKSGADSEQIAFTFDRLSCDNQPKTAALADDKTLAELAFTVAKNENEAAGSDGSGKPSTMPFHPSEATAHQGIVDERFTVRDSSAKAITPANRGKITALVTGYFCTKYRDAISQGVAFHHHFVLADQSPVIDFTIDRSSC